MTSSNMTCEEFDAALPDYLEGTLDESLRVAVERHLSECVRCTSLLRDLEKIRREAATLPDLLPSRDLWQGIEARIAAPVIPLTARPERQRRVAPAWMGIAAAALIMSTAGLTYMLTARSFRPAPNGTIVQVAPLNSQTQSDSGSDSGTAAGSTEPAQVGLGSTGTQPSGSGTRVARGGFPDRQRGIPVSLASQQTSEQAHSDLVYGREIDMLQKIVNQRKTQLDSATIAIIERNLQIIDAAIEQSRAALARDPASQMLGQQLTHTLDKKVELLRTAAMLPAST
jgi:hypothetical protein